MLRRSWRRPNRPVSLGHSSRELLVSLSLHTLTSIVEKVSGVSAMEAKRIRSAVASQTGTTEEERVLFTSEKEALVMKALKERIEKMRKKRARSGPNPLSQLKGKGVKKTKSSAGADEKRRARANVSADELLERRLKAKERKKERKGKGKEGALAESDD